MISGMGYLLDQKGIINRYLREEGGWDTHLNHCREYILRAIRRHNPSVVTILGSGWLLDVPLEEMTDHVELINLVDIYHPSQVRNRVKRLNGVNLIEEDLTGGVIDNIWRKVKAGLNDSDKIDMTKYKPLYEPGLVVSLNLLTQTDTLIVDYITKKTDLSHDHIRVLRRGIQSAHIDYLESVNSVLITDHLEEIYTDGVLTETNNLLFTDLPQGNQREDWIWDFDTSGLYYRCKKVIFKVAAIDLE